MIQPARDGVDESTTGIGAGGNQARFAMGENEESFLRAELEDRGTAGVHLEQELVGVTRFETGDRQIEPFAVRRDQPWHHDLERPLIVHHSMLPLLWSFGCSTWN